MESGDVSDSLQLGELLHKFFNAEPRKLYRNLCVFPFTFAFENHSLSIFRVSNALAAAKTGFSGRLGNRDLRSRELLTAGGKKLCDVVDRTSRLAACGSFFARCWSWLLRSADADLRLHSSNADRRRCRVAVRRGLGRVVCAAYPPQVLAGTGALRSSIKWLGISLKKRDGVENSGESLP